MDLNELLARRQRASYLGVNAASRDERRCQRRSASMFGAEIRMLRLAFDQTAPIIWDRKPVPLGHS